MLSAIIKLDIGFFVQANRGAGAQRVTVNVTDCGVDFYWMKLYIYLNVYLNYFAFDFEAKRCVELRHSTRIVSKNNFSVLIF